MHDRWGEKDHSCMSEYDLGHADGRQDAVKTINLLMAMVQRGIGVGTRVRLTRPVDRLHDQTVPEGYEGTVTHVGRGNYSTVQTIGVRMDLYLGSAFHEYENAVLWNDDDVYDFLLEVERA